MISGVSRKSQGISAGAQHILLAAVPAGCHTTGPIVKNLTAYLSNEWNRLVSPATRRPRSHDSALVPNGPGMGCRSTGQCAWYWKIFFFLTGGATVYKFVHKASCSMSAVGHVLSGPCRPQILAIQASVHAAPHLSVSHGGCILDVEGGGPRRPAAAQVASGPPRRDGPRH